MLLASQTEEITQRLSLFRQDLGLLDADKLVLKHISSGKSVVLDENLELELKKQIADFFDVSFHDIFLVGSAKTGFSIAPTKTFTYFGDTSDIDIAIVSPILFNKVWESAHAYRESRAEWPEKSNFFKYLSAGWIRPDMLPPASSFDLTSTWWEFFNRLSTSNPLRINVRGALYSSYFFLHAYQKASVAKCKELQNDYNCNQ